MRRPGRMSDALRRSWRVEYGDDAWMAVSDRALWAPRILGRLPILRAVSAYPRTAVPGHLQPCHSGRVAVPASSEPIPTLRQASENCWYTCDSARIRVAGRVVSSTPGPIGPDDSQPDWN